MAKKFLGSIGFWQAYGEKDKGSQKRLSNKFKGNEVKYIKFANFAALLTMVAKILAHWCSCVGHPCSRTKFR